MIYEYCKVLNEDYEQEFSLRVAAALHPLEYTKCSYFYSKAFASILSVYIKKIDKGYNLLVTDGLYKFNRDIETNDLDELKDYIVNLHNLPVTSLYF